MRNKQEIRKKNSFLIEFIFLWKGKRNLIKSVSYIQPVVFQRVIVRNTNLRLLPQSYPIRRNYKGGVWQSELRDALGSLAVPEV